MDPSRYRHRIIDECGSVAFAHSQLHILSSFRLVLFSVFVRIIKLYPRFVFLVIKLSTISIGQLRALLHFHTRPIYLVVFKGSLDIFISGISNLKVGFTLRCLQRLSLPHFATLLCHWRDNRCTIGASIPVLSY